MNKIKIDSQRLSKIISHALRHNPAAYELVMDEKGWVSLKDLVIGLRCSSKEWTNIQVQHIEDMVNNSPKKRFEISNNNIRALYGHSSAVHLSLDPAEPPAQLFVSLSAEEWEEAKNWGVKPSLRQYVHLSVRQDDAQDIGNKRDQEHILISVQAKDAFQAGNAFYAASPDVWLADTIPAEFLTQM